LQAWENAMGDPRVLLHPIFKTSSNQHRHDQSILSALIAKSEISCCLINEGFYSQGVESNSEHFEDSWIYTGNISSIETQLRIGKRLTLVLDHYSRILYDILKSFLILPIHLAYICAEKLILKLKQGLLERAK